MKKSIFILFLILSITLQSQSIDISVGYSPNGIGGSIDYNYHLSNKAIVRASIYASYANFKYRVYKVPYSDLSLNIGYFHPLYENRRESFQIAAGLGGLVGYELVNINGEPTLPNGVGIKTDSTYIYGGFLSGEMNFVLSSNLILLLKYNQYYHLNSNMGPLSMYSGAGIRFFLN